ncbi:MAG: sulfate permease [Chloroflexi bacterium]|nr:sulfate permease [Chloroflexota bacterium]
MALQLGPFRLTRSEVSGALADLGVLVPLEAALISINGLNPTATLLGVGILYIGAGLYFRLPIPVQPLKALGVIAIAQDLSPSVIAAGALLMAVALTLLAVTGATDRLYRLLPLPVVRGIQFGLGLLLLKAGAQFIVQKPFPPGASPVPLALVGVVPVGLVLGVGALALLLVLLRWPVAPASVAVLALGAAAGAVLGLRPAGDLVLGPQAVALSLPGVDAFAVAATALLIPQLPLTLGNSVIATADTARAYFGAGAGRATPRRLSFSIALGNLWAGLVGGLPVCHGSGGLTAHYRLGARTPAASIVIGGLCILVAVLFGRSALAIRTLVPFAIYGALLLYVGWQHLQLGLKVEGRTQVGVVVFSGIVAMAFDGNLGLGALGGLAAYGALRGWKAWREARAMRGPREASSSERGRGS